MFEIGIQLRRQRGAENVFDFSLGNPEVEPPAAVMDALRRVVAEDLPHAHGYMPNAGYPEVRARLARRLAASTGLPFAAEHLIMTCGAAGAINTVLKSILDPGDEVIVLNPYFPRRYSRGGKSEHLPIKFGKVAAPTPSQGRGPDLGVSRASGVTPVIRFLRA